MSPIRIAPRCRPLAGPLVGVVLALAVPSTLAATAQQTPTAAQPVTNPPPLLPLTADEVLTQVRRSVTWYHALAAVEQISLQGVGPLARGELQQQALTTVSKAFEFGKAAEDILGRQAQAQSASVPSGGGKAAAQSTAPTLPARLAQEAAHLSAQEATLKAEIAAIEARLSRTRGANARAAIAAQRAGLVAALQLVRQIGSNVDQLRRFQESAIARQGKSPKGLRAQLKALESSIPELSTGEGGSAAAVPATGGHAAPTSVSKSTPTNFQPQSAGIVPLIGQWYALHDNRVQVQGAINDTTTLEGQVTATRSRLLATVRRLVGSGMASIATGSTTQLATQRPTIEAATGELRELSSAIIPLAEQALMLSKAQTTLEDWRNTLAAQESSAARYLGIRIGILLAWVAAVLIIAEIWRRVTFRYLADARRRRPFLMLRRIVLGMALILVIIFNLVSQVGSIATYAGLLTAGLAVALQNVILAVVAYFFLIGRYGVRVGDRVTISGVTGRVVDISLLRVYLMELVGPDLHSTGRMVVLSNAVLFQPTALFKQIPGAEYLWHSVTLTIVATADFEKAYGSLQAAADRVYETYRSAIQRQHVIAQRFIEFETVAPAPEVRLRLTDNGLECAVRYPVVTEKAARIDQQMLDALRKALEGDEQLKLVASGGMALKSSES
ncbi:MAG: mechanosensitive ion channel family protein [Steroidobacteraceae bacterium]